MIIFFRTADDPFERPATSCFVTVSFVVFAQTIEQ